jgi:hypothetical protein
MQDDNKVKLGRANLRAAGSGWIAGLLQQSCSYDKRVAYMDGSCRKEEKGTKLKDYFNWNELTSRLS